MSKILIFIFFCCLSSVISAAINDDLKAATRIGLQKIDKEKDICFTNAKFSGVAAECLASAIKRKQVLLDALTDIRANQAGTDAQEILNIFSDQEKFNKMKDSCNTLLKLSQPNNSFDFTYRCQLDVQDLYFSYL
ncbi:hypothetical protein [Acinetobacter junii]|uniref:hypothetical protein n=1 Tax=Acinetobacter junii TaxID=40215 RepID=UPI0021CD36F1|nr:hypothetical protein [Acinetobacter junii]MCU4406704.1 hypothetical protein [Acinetobacter junii]